MDRTISYQEQPISAGRHILVLRHFRVIGTIRADAPGGAHRYYHGSHNEVNPQLEERDLETLKATIESRYSAETT